jgi:hypothetical protein
MVLKHRKHLIPVLLIEAWCLKAIGGEDDLMATTGTGFLLCCLEQLGPHPLSPQGLMDPECADITTAIPGPSFDPNAEALLVITDKDCQPLPIVHPGLRGIISRTREVRGGIRYQWNA